MQGLNFRGGNPGAVQHGNFINYYQFHPAESRLAVLPKDIWVKEEVFIGLDIGCNTGDLTLGLHKFLTENVNQSCYMLGIDIDPTLIERANEKNTSKSIKFLCLNFMDAEKRNELISDYLASVGATKFSASFCFSVTMWIHLNNGDDGLRTFLHQLCAVSAMIVIEPQPWKCYKTAVKRMKLSKDRFPEFRKLKIREDVERQIEHIVLDFKNVLKIKETERTGWGRKTLFFRIV